MYYAIVAVFSSDSRCHPCCRLHRQECSSLDFWGGMCKAQSYSIEKWVLIGWSEVLFSSSPPWSRGLGQVSCLQDPREGRGFSGSRIWLTRYHHPSMEYRAFHWLEPRRELHRGGGRTPRRLRGFTRKLGRY